MSSSSFGLLGRAWSGATHSLSRKGSHADLTAPQQQPTTHTPANPAFTRKHFTSPPALHVPRFRKRERSSGSCDSIPEEAEEGSSSSPGAASDADELSLLFERLDSNSIDHRDTLSDETLRDWIRQASPSPPPGQASVTGDFLAGDLSLPTSESAAALLAAFPTPPTSHSPHLPKTPGYTPTLSPVPGLGAPFTPKPSPVFRFEPPTEMPSIDATLPPMDPPPALPLPRAPGTGAGRRGSGLGSELGGKVIRRRASESVLFSKTAVPVKDFDPSHPPTMALPPLPTPTPTPSPRISSTTPTATPPRDRRSARQTKTFSSPPPQLAPLSPTTGLGISFSPSPPAAKRTPLRGAKSMASLRPAPAPPSPERVTFDDLTNAPLPRRRVSRRQSSLLLDQQRASASADLLNSGPSPVSAFQPLFFPVTQSPPLISTATFQTRDEKEELAEDGSETDSEIDMEASFETMAWRAGVMHRSRLMSETEPPKVRLARVHRSAPASTTPPGSPPTTWFGRPHKVNVYKLERKLTDEPEEVQCESSEEEEEFDRSFDGNTSTHANAACAALSDTASSRASTQVPLSPFSQRWRASIGSTSSSVESPEQHKVVPVSKLNTSVDREGTLSPAVTALSLRVAAKLKEIAEQRASWEGTLLAAAQPGTPHWRASSFSAPGGTEEERDDTAHLEVLGEYTEEKSTLEEMAESRASIVRPKAVVKEDQTITPKPSTIGRPLPQAIPPSPERRPLSFTRRPSESESSISSVATDSASSESGDTRRSSAASSVEALPPVAKTKPVLAPITTSSLPIARASISPKSAHTSLKPLALPARTDSMRKQPPSQPLPSLPPVTPKAASLGRSTTTNGSNARGRIPTLNKAKSHASLSPSNSRLPSPSARSPTPTGGSLIPRSTTPTNLPRAIPRKVPSISSLKYVGPSAPSSARSSGGLVLPQIVAAGAGEAGAKKGLPRPVATAPRRA